MIDLFENKEAWKSDAESSEFDEWRSSMIDLIPKLQYDSLIELGMYLGFEAKVNDKHIWRAFEDAALDNLHLYDLKHAC